MARKTTWVRVTYDGGRTIETEVEVVTWIGLAGMEYRSTYNGEQRVSSSHVVAVVVLPDGRVASASLDELRRKVSDGA